METATNTISEEYLAAAILNSPKEAMAIVESEGGIDLFHNYLPRMIYNMTKGLLSEGREHEVETLEFSDQIIAAGDGREVSHGISKIRCQFSGMSWVAQHLKNAKKSAALRKATRILSDASQGIREGHTPEQVSEALRSGSRAIMGIISSDDDVKSAKKSAEEFSSMIRAIHYDKIPKGIKTGIYGLDQQTGGLGANELWVVAAQTSRGKTVLMFQIMAALLEQKKHCLLISLETEASRIHSRLAANVEDIPLCRILGTNNEPCIKSDFVKLKSYIERTIKNDCLHISDSDQINLETITAQADRIKEKGYALDCIIVDYIQLVTLADNRDKARHEQVAEVTRTFKQLAKRYQCPVLTASQLNDDGKVRESRAIAQDADVLLKITDESDGIIIEKNRNGQRGYKLDLALNGDKQRFE